MLFRSTYGPRDVVVSLGLFLSLFLRVIRVVVVVVVVVACYCYPVVQPS